MKKSEKPEARYLYLSGLACSTFYIDLKNDIESIHKDILNKNYLTQNYNQLFVDGIFRKILDCIKNILNQKRELYSDYHSNYDEVILESLINVSKLGSKKYGLFDYQENKELKIEDFLDAIYRHIFKNYVLLEDEDKESELDHHYHIVANLQIIAYLIEREIYEKNLKNKTKI